MVTDASTAREFLKRLIDQLDDRHVQAAVQFLETAHEGMSTEDAARQIAEAMDDADRDQGAAT